MGGLRTTAEEVGHIRSLADKNWSYADIARRVKRSPSFVSNVMNNPDKFPAPEVKQTESVSAGGPEETVTVGLKVFLKTILHTGLSPEEKITLIKTIIT